MNQQSSRIVQDSLTSLPPADVLVHAKRFFTQRTGVYSAFLEKEGPGHLVFRGQGGEELVIGVADAPGGTRVTASTYLFDQQIARFLTSLAPYVAPEPVETPALDTPDAPAALPAGGAA